MFGSVISWAEAVPAGSESIGLGDDRIRSLKTDVRTALDDEHIWPSSGGTAGLHRTGSARAYFGTQSRVSASTTSAPAADGRMMLASDTTRLFAAGSEGTALLGAGPLSLSLGSFASVTLPQRAYVVIEIGREASDGAGRFVVTFPNSGFSGVPFMYLQSGVSNFPAAGYSANLNAVTASGFSAHIRDLDNNLTASQVSLHWMAVGHRTL